MKITSLDHCPERGVSHNPAIRKHLLIDGNGIPGITNFSRAVFPAGAVAPVHQHADMTEVFYLESGSGEIEIDGRSFPLTAGSCITVEPGEDHELRNTGRAEMCVLYFGVRTDIE